jgi:hypothetical protein
MIGTTTFRDRTLPAMSKVPLIFCDLLPTGHVRFCPHPSDSELSYVFSLSITASSQVTAGSPDGHGYFRPFFQVAAFPHSASVGGRLFSNQH